MLDKSQAGALHSVDVVYVNNKKEFMDRIKSTKKPQKDLVGTNWNLYFGSKNLVPKIPMVSMSETGKVKFGTKTGHKDFFCVVFS